MEAVLHVEPITRSIPAPLSIGHSDYLFFGEGDLEDGENVGATSSNIRLGCPLSTADTGSTRTTIPLVKTYEFVPDASRSTGNVYSETTHLFVDDKYLIPFRTKIRSGLGQGLRLTHIPSLNEARKKIVGLSEPICDARSDIVSDLFNHDPLFNKSKNRPLCDWIFEDLTTNLASITTSNISFDVHPTSCMINGYVDQVYQTPSEFLPRHARDITSTLIPERSLAPIGFLSADPIVRPLQYFRNHLVPHSADLKTLGAIPVAQLEKIDSNPFHFQMVCDLLDCIPLTDFNIDLVVSTDYTIELFHINAAINRMAHFADSDLGLYNPRTILEDYLSEDTVKEILTKFLYHHSAMTQELQDLICSRAIKMKIVKSITDEAIILLYPHDSGSQCPPLCGVYFDIALQSLAPMNIVPAAVMDMYSLGNQALLDPILPNWNSPIRG